MAKKEARKRIFKKILENIRSLKIQGANDVAKAALIAYELFPTQNTVKKLLASRPTEPLMKNILSRAKNESYKEILFQLNSFQDKINENISGIIENGDIIFTHCHSTSVTKALIYAKKKGKRFIVYTTETRPLFQGRRTANDLVRNEIETCMFVDSSAMIALNGEQGMKKPTKMIIGSDALTKDGVINKVGSGMFAKISHENRIPVYVVANSWKFTNEKLKIEQRDRKEVWDNAPRQLKIRNFAFEEIEKRYITKIVSELGILNYEEFLRKVS